MSTASWNLCSSLNPRYEKRRMLDRLTAIIAGASAVADAGSDELKARLAKLVTPIRKVVDQAVKSEAVDAEVASAVIQLAADVNRVVTSWNGAAAPAGAPPAAGAPAAGAPAAAAAAPGS